FPNLGADGLAFEFDSTDANGPRSGLAYVSNGWKGVVEGYTMLQSYDNFNEDGSIAGLTAQEYNEAMAKANAGTIDLLYKNEHGYSSYHKGSQHRNERMDGLQYQYNIDLWQNIVNNPRDIIAEGVNAAA